MISSRSSTAERERAERGVCAECQNAVWQRLSGYSPNDLTGLCCYCQIMHFYSFLENFVKDSRRNEGTLITECSAAAGAGAPEEMTKPLEHAGAGEIQEIQGSPCQACQFAVWHRWGALRCFCSLTGSVSYEEMGVKVRTCQGADPDFQGAGQSQEPQQRNMTKGEQIDFLLD